MTIGSDIRDTHFEMIYRETKDFGMVQFVEKIEALENKIDSLEETIDELERDQEDLEEDYNNLYDELEEFIKNYGGELFN